MLTESPQTSLLQLSNRPQLSLFCFFTSRPHTKQKKKLSRNQPITVRVHRVDTSNQASSLSKLVMGIQYCKCMASLYKHWEISQQRCKSLQMCMYGFSILTYGELHSAVTQIQRRESTIPAIKFLVLIHSACPCKNYALKCSQFLHELFFLSTQCVISNNHHTKLKKIVQIASQCWTTFISSPQSRVASQCCTWKSKHFHVQ